MGNPTAAELVEIVVDLQRRVKRLEDDMSEGSDFDTRLEDLEREVFPVETPSPAAATPEIRPNKTESEK